MNEVAQPPVPAIGISAKYPEIGTGPVATAIYHEPAVYEKEMAAILRRSWYMIGRVEQVARPGDFFTYLLPTFKLEVLVCRDRDGDVGAFHNVCTHRGNVVENRREGHSSGLFMCRFHGWSFDLEGRLARVRDEEGFFGLDKTCLGLKAIAMGVWQGFIWVCPEDEPYQSLEDFLGEQGRDAAGYAWDACTQFYQTEADVACNWKLVNDSPAEVYHIPVLHPTSAAPTMMASGNVMGRLLDVEVRGNHRTNSHYSVMGEPKPVQKLAYFHAAAAQNVLRDDLEDAMPVGINATRSPFWTVDLIMFFPTLAFTLSAGMYTAHQVWPMGPSRSIYQQRVFMRPAQTAAERFGQENTMVEYRDIVLEDFSTLERIQRALDSGQIRQFHYHDHELALRHQHHVVTKILADYDREQAGEN
jgi:phenylpropionate dioxygenase-like ring-hydroxylating dioxygenase large terminal subunit